MAGKLSSVQRPCLLVGWCSRASCIMAFYAAKMKNGKIWHESNTFNYYSLKWFICNGNAICNGARETMTRNKYERRVMILFQFRKLKNVNLFTSYLKIVIQREWEEKSSQHIVVFSFQWPCLALLLFRLAYEFSGNLKWSTDPIMHVLANLRAFHFHSNKDLS